MFQLCFLGSLLDSLFGQIVAILITTFWVHQLIDFLKIFECYIITHADSVFIEYN
jgi:hypothetical protein